MTHALLGDIPYRLNESAFLRLTLILPLKYFSFFLLSDSLLIVQCITTPGLLATKVMTKRRAATDKLLGETGVKSTKKCNGDSVAKGKQPKQIFRGSFRTLISWLFSESECFPM